MFQVYFDVFSNIQSVHVPTLIVSLICITVLYLTRTFVNGNPKIMKVIKVPVPIELLVVCSLTCPQIKNSFVFYNSEFTTNTLLSYISLQIVFGTIASYFMQLDEVWQVRTVRTIPTGLPHPHSPSWQDFPNVLTRSFSVAVVAATVLISLGKIFASKHHYKINPNQELFAIGLANIFGAFFLCVPATGALARSTVQEAVGGKTQVCCNSFCSA